ncbi:MAG: hypothetical protein ACRD0K_26270 [Egibacteraceae bacterium]
MRKYFGVGSAALLGLGWDPEAGRWWTWMTPEEVVEEMLHRRKMLRGMGVAGLAGTAGLLLPVSALVADAQELGGRGLDGRGRIGEGDAADAEKTATKLAVAYSAAPDADARRAARAHAYTLLALLRPGGATMDLGTRARLQAVASDAAALVGYGCLDAGQFAEADRWFRCALALAREAGDRRLEALATASSAWPALDAPKPDRAAALAAFGAAAELQRYLPPAGQSWVFGYLARQHAGLSHDLASGRFLDVARNAAARIRSDGSGWGWWSTHAELGSLNGTRLEVFTGRRSLLLGCPADALQIFDGALASTTAPVRRAFLHENIVQASVALGDPERAEGSAHTALDECDSYGIALVASRIRRARRTFPGEWSIRTSTIELDERLRLAA